MKRVHLIAFFTICFTGSLLAQGDTLLELTTNGKLRAFHNKQIESGAVKQSYINKSTLTLPFFDDFSQNYLYPDTTKWENINVHINSNMANDPVNWGVATFDGLDSTGYPYNFGNPTSYGAADTLTSRKIDVTTVIDSLFLSFYYQPQGNGNKPETRDSLTLQFYRKRDSTWVRMWGADGEPLQPFRQVMIPVDTSFQNNEFQFRFINWATLSGNVDHWNLDHVYLDENRNYLDTALNDVSFITNHHNMLAEFTAMPWTHYVSDSLNFMAPAMDVTYKNNHNTTYAVFYKYRVIDNNGAGPILETYPSTTSSKNAPAWGELIEPQAVYDINPVFINDFYFPPDASQTKVFQIRNYFDLNSIVDDHPENDTVNSYQVFGSYYAYDDGSAETGYGVQGVGSKLAHEFDFKIADTLTAFQIYFSPIMNNHSAQSVRLKVWSSLNPEVEVYSQPASLFMSPVYSNMNEFLNYQLDVPVYLPAGTYYIGWEKISSEFLNVGWDVNTNNRTKVHFNSVGVWQNASFDGSLMLRPVFGTYADPQVSVEEIVFEEDNFSVFPNPASTVLNFQVDYPENYKVELLTMSGQLLKSQLATNKQMNTQDLSAGLYIVRLTNINTQAMTHKKVIISK